MSKEVSYHVVLSTDDMDFLANGVKVALKDSPYTDIEPDMDALKALIMRFCVDKSNGDRFAIVAVADDVIVGMIAGAVLDDHFIFSNHKAGQELLWWVHEDYRKSGVSEELLKALDQWAKVKGLKHMFSSHYHNKYTTKMKAMYKTLGYKPVEYSYWKELT